MNDECSPSLPHQPQRDVRAQCQLQESTIQGCNELSGREISVPQEWLFVEYTPLD